MTYSFAVPEPDQEYLSRIYKELHEYPELGHDLEKTVGVVKRELTALGVDYTEAYDKCSVVCTLGPKDARKCIALRGDMDALPIQETTGLPYASKVPGVMHACGHDAHTTMLLGTAKILRAIEDKLTCRVKLIFQPSEEITPSGARAMCENGVMDDVTEILTAHQTPGRPVGTIRLNKTCMNASCHAFNIYVYGKSAHVANPQSGVDALPIANRIFMDIQTMRAREINPFDPVVVGIGAMNGGKAKNVICDYVKMMGTIRAHSQRVEDYVKRRIDEIAAAAAAGLNARVEVEWCDFIPAVHNDHKIADRIIDIGTRVLGEGKVEEMGLQMGSEDFAFFIEKKPGARFMFGVMDEAVGPTKGHNSGFRVALESLQVPVKIFVTYILENMSQEEE